MKLGAFVNITEPEARQDIWLESIASVIEWADKVVIVDGSDEEGYDKNKKRLNEYFDNNRRLHVYNYYWSKDWSWSELPRHLNYGLSMCCDCDWAIRFDIDYVFTDDFGDYVKDKLRLLADKRVATFQKFSSVLYNRFYQKGGVQLGINMQYKNTLFGMADEYTDLCVPIIQVTEKNGVPIGKLVPDNEVGKTGLDFFNYDYAFKTKEFTKNEFYRFLKAHKEYFGKTDWGETKNQAFKIFMNMMSSRLDKCVYDIPVDEQPSFIKGKLEELGPDEFSYNGWGKLVEKSDRHVKRLNHNKR